MSNVQDIKSIINYYDELDFIFKTEGENLHHGLWYENTKNLQEAYENSNKCIADYLDVKNNDKVLDAGCGHGGTSIYLAKNYGARVVGINISEKQLERARKYAEKAGKDLKLEFLNRSFLDTGFEDESFTKVIAIESIVYAKDTMGFIKEVYRLLKPGGRLAVMEAFRLRDDLNEKEERLYQKFCNCFHADLACRDDFKANLLAAGFKNIQFHDKSANVQKTASINAWLATPFFPVVWILRKLRMVSDTLYNLVDGLREQKKLADSTFLTYGVFVAEK